jgi:carbamoyl-phosphate synthase large subunit
MLNCNPESVSTDFEIADRLYFEELSLERVLDIYESENPEGVLLSMGGQIPNALAIPLARLQVPVFGTNPADIDRAEDRNKFGALLDQLNILQPDWAEVTSAGSAQEFAQKNGYPVLIRQSVVSSGSTTSIAWDDASLKTFIARTAEISPDYPAIVTRYAENSKEIEIDAVANKGEVLVYALSEHIENAGVHSGDATVVLPAQRIYLSTAQAIKKAARKIASALEITGPFNIKFLAKSTNIQVLECNLRASRSFPFCSKVFRIDMAEIATKAQLSLEVKKIGGSQLDFDYVGVRAAQFSYSRLKGADPVAGVEMASTGEVGCIGRGVRDAFMKAMLSTGYRIPKKKILLSTGPLEDKVDFIDSAKKLLALGYELVASSGTARFLQNNDIPAKALAWPLEEKKPNIAEALQNHEIDLVINIPKNNRETELKNDYIIRRMTIDYDIPLITNIKIAKQFTDSLEWYKTRGLEVKSREEYR